MIQIGVQFNLYKNLKSSGGLRGAAAPPHDVRRIDDSTRGAIKSLYKI